MENFLPGSPHTWIILLTFPICIVFIIIAPSLPVFIPKYQFFIFIYNKLLKKEDGFETTNLFYRIHIPIDMGVSPVLSLLFCIIIFKKSICNNYLRF
jgi:hypothetical protein